MAPGNIVGHLAIPPLSRESEAKALTLRARDMALGGRDEVRSGGGESLGAP